jgi:serine/threonine-protein kinase
LLVAAGVASIVGGGLLHRQRAAVDAGAGRQAVEAGQAVDEKFAAFKTGLKQELDQVADIPQLRSALANRADPLTLADLFEHEDWWDVYRNRGAAIVIGGDVLVTQGLDRAAVLDCARRAPTTEPSVRTLESKNDVFLVAIGTFKLPRAGINFTLLLGVPLDRGVLGKMLAPPAVAVALSDGRRVRMSVGDGEVGAAASTLVGHEGEGPFAPSGADWSGAAVPVADKLWLLGLAHRQGQALPFALVVACGAGGLALILLGAAMMLWRGRDSMQAEAVATVSAQAPSFISPAGRLISAERGPGPSIPLAVVPPSSPRLTAPAPVVGPPGGLALATALAAEGGQQFGRYRLIERIGEGGMAEVFTAVMSGAEGFERQVVIKRLKPHLALNPEAVAQFIDEAKLGSVLAHSNIVTVADFGKVGDGYYLAAEFVDGYTLAQIAARYREKFGRNLPAAIVYHVVHEVLAGVAYAHDRADTHGRPLGIVHRDVSPTNIMISFEGDVKLLDFGIVKAAERVTKTKEGNVKGNVGYMSPEQARGQDVSARSDLFSLGLVMFELLSGEPFYQGGGASEIMYQAATGPTVEHLARIAKLPPPAPELLRRVLALDPASRFPSARAFAQALSPSATMLKGQLAQMMRSLFR